MPLTRSATGGAFLAYLPQQITQTWVKKELADHARHGLSPASRDEVDQMVAQTRRRGFARTSEFIPGISGMAAPVFDHTGEMILALIALGYSKPFDAHFDKIAATVLRKAATLSQRCGFRAPPGGTIETT
jgi:DNA-binding IclR family transcriptional regulator